MPLAKLRRLARLAPDDRRLLLAAAVTLVAVRAGLWLAAPRLMRYVDTRTSTMERLGSAARHPATARVAWAVTLAGRYVPGPACLAQALAARLLLARRGLSADFHIGVAKGGDGRLEAHAWLESEGRVLVGRIPGLATYAPLPELFRS